MLDQGFPDKTAQVVEVHVMASRQSGLFEHAINASPLHFNFWLPDCFAYGDSMSRI